MPRNYVTQLVTIRMYNLTQLVTIRMYNLRKLFLILEYSLITSYGIHKIHIIVIVNVTHSLFFFCFTYSLKPMTRS